MKEDFDKLLSEIDVEIAKIDLYGNDIIETSLSIVRHLQSIITGLRNELQTYTFPTQEDEIRFFKVQKPELQYAMVKQSNVKIAHRKYIG